MEGLLRLSEIIDAINRRIGRTVMWLVLVAVLVSTINAVVRKAFDVSSNAWLELQWHLFSAVFLLGAAYTLQHERAHPHRHPQLASAQSRARRDRPRRPLPVPDAADAADDVRRLAVLLGVLAHRRAVAERRRAAAWPAKLLVPAGFFLLFIQGISEIIKRIGVMRGLMPDPHEQGEHAPGHTAPLE